MCQGVGIGEDLKPQARAIATSGQVLPRQYEVFINFRGDELRRNFVSHLVKALESHHINLFIDEREQRGEDLRDLLVRIEESRIALVIFSKRYAESKWCLDELVKIVKQVKMGKMRVMPIFFEVNVADVKPKDLKGKFGDAFWGLARKICRRGQIENWMRSLKSACRRMGLELSDKCDESDLIEKNVKAVKRALKTDPYEEPMPNYSYPKTKKRKHPYAFCESFNSTRRRSSKF